MSPNNRYSKLVALGCLSIGATGIRVVTAEPAGESPEAALVSTLSPDLWNGTKA
jgi:hypothetical protein